MNQNKRVGWIDIMRGICILAIVMGHVWGFGYIRQYLFSFHVPIFFFLSGYCFKYTNSIKNYFLKKVRTIIVPYGFFSIASIILFGAAGMFVSKINAVMDCNLLNNLLVMAYGNSKPDVMKYNSPLWFLTCFFCVNIIAYFIERIAAKTKKYAVRCIGIIILSTIGIFIAAHNDIRLPWHLETAVSMTVWYMLGIISADPDTKISVISEKLRKSHLQLLCAVIMLIGGGILAFTNNCTVGVRNDSYGIIPIYYCSTLLSISGFYLLCIMISKCRFLEYIGRNSMAILVFHKFPILVFQEVIPFTAKYLQKANSVSGVLIGIIVLFVSTAISLMLGKLSEIIIPWALGKKRFKDTAL